MERCESGRIGRFRKPLSRKAPGVRIPLSPIRRRGNIAVGDSKRGPADPREEKGTEGCGGFETRSRRPLGGRRDRGRPRRGALVRAIPPAPMGIKEKSFGGDSKRGPADLGRRKGPKAAPKGRIPLSPIRRRGNIAVGDSKRGPADPREEKGTEGDKKERGLFIVFILYLTCKSIDLEW